MTHPRGEPGHYDDDGPPMAEEEQRVRAEFWRTKIAVHEVQEDPSRSEDAIQALRAERDRAQLEFQRILNKRVPRFRKWLKDRRMRRLL